MLSELERMFLAREVLMRDMNGTGIEVDALTGPIYWHTPDNAMAQIVSQLSAELLIAHMPQLFLVAQILNAKGYLKNKTQIPSEWAAKRRVKEGLINPVCLKAGIGEGAGISRVLGFDVYDYDILDIYENVSAAPITEEGVRNAWLQKPRNKDLAYSSFAIATLAYFQHVGMGIITNLVDTGRLTKHSVLNLRRSGFALGEKMVNLSELMGIMEGGA